MHVVHDKVGHYLRLPEVGRSDGRLHDEHADQTAMAKDLCDAVGPVLGSYPGNRVTHTKGVNLTGTFTATRAPVSSRGQRTCRATRSACSSASRTATRTRGAPTRPRTTRAAWP